MNAVPRHTFDIGEPLRSSQTSTWKKAARERIRIESRSSKRCRFASCSRGTSSVRSARSSPPSSGEAGGRSFNFFPDSPGTSASLNTTTHDERDTLSLSSTDTERDTARPANIQVTKEANNLKTPTTEQLVIQLKEKIGTKNNTYQRAHKTLRSKITNTTHNHNSPPHRNYRTPATPQPQPRTTNTTTTTHCMDTLGNVTFSQLNIKPLNSRCHVVQAMVLMVPESHSLVDEQASTNWLYTSLFLFENAALLPPTLREPLGWSRENTRWCLVPSPPTPSSKCSSWPDAPPVSQPL